MLRSHVAQLLADIRQEHFNVQMQHSLVRSDEMIRSKKEMKLER
jgi:hypothetical protein